MKHAHIVPLVGGAAIGASLALKSNPEYIASWAAFAKNDQFCKEYFIDTPFHIIEDKSAIRLPKRVDIMTCVPPCSGLSTSTPSSSRGCAAPQNEHMLRVAEYGMLTKTQVIIIENAPTLYSQGGEEFAERFLPLTKKYGYSMVLLLTSTILHGLPQNRKRSFVLLYKGSRIPEFEWIQKPYKPLHEWRPENKSTVAKDWSPKTDEMIQALKKHFKVKNNAQLLKGIALEYNNNPVTGWRVVNDFDINHRFKCEPYKYMQKTSEMGNGIMDRSPYLVWDHCNALMWKSAHKMINPAAPDRQFNIRELMNLMGMPKDFAEIPAKDINVLFQNVPVTTVKTLVEEVVRQLDRSAGWYKPEEKITRLNNIKQTVDVFNK